MPRYKTEWKPHNKNEDFWREVMIGRTITDLVFDEKGVRALVLDDGQQILIPNTFAIKD